MPEKLTTVPETTQPTVPTAEDEAAFVAWDRAMQRAFKGIFTRRQRLTELSRALRRKAAEDAS